MTAISNLRLICHSLAPQKPFGSFGKCLMALLVVVRVDRVTTVCRLTVDVRRVVFRVVLTLLAAIVDRLLTHKTKQKSMNQ